MGKLHSLLTKVAPDLFMNYLYDRNTPAMQSMHRATSESPCFVRHRRWRRASACAFRDPRVYLCPELSIMVVSRSLVVRGAAVARAGDVGKRPARRCSIGWG